MYDELVKRLRELASIPEHCENVADCDKCPKEEICLSFTNKRIIEVATQAADAIEELQAYVDLYKDLTEKGEKVARGVIDKYPKWIPVEERLPDKSGYYLIVTHLGLTDDAEDWMKDNAVDVTMAHYADYSNIWTTDSGAAYNADLSKCDKTRYEYVTHWMPLPEPPKEE